MSKLVWSTRMFVFVCFSRYAENMDIHSTLLRNLKWWYYLTKKLKIILFLLIKYDISTPCQMRFCPKRSGFYTFEKIIVGGSTKVHQKLANLRSAVKLKQLLTQRLERIPLALLRGNRMIRSKVRVNWRDALAFQSAEFLRCCHLCKSWKNTRSCARSS